MILPASFVSSPRNVARCPMVWRRAPRTLIARLRTAARLPEAALPDTAAAAAHPGASSTRGWVMAAKTRIPHPVPVGMPRGIGASRSWRIRLRLRGSAADGVTVLLPPDPVCGIAASYPRAPCCGDVWQSLQRPRASSRGHAVPHRPAPWADRNSSRIPWSVWPLLVRRGSAPQSCCTRLRFIFTSSGTADALRPLLHSRMSGLLPSSCIRLPASRDRRGAEYPLTGRLSLGRTDCRTIE